MSRTERDKHAKAVTRARRDSRLARDTRELAEARRLFEELPPELRRRLAVELARTRKLELRRAYRSLVAVGAGFRLKQHENGGAATVRDEPCVVLTVRTKRPHGQIAPRQRLPTELLCYVEHNGARRLCAVPTDVDQQAASANATPQVGVDVEPPAGNEPNQGSVACIIQRRDDLDDSWLVSARHVLGHSGWLAVAAPVTTVQPRGGGVPFAEASTFFRGAVSDAFVPSCDVQLARVTDSDAARAALSGLRFDDYVLEHEEIPRHLFVLTHRGALPVSFFQAAPGAAFPIDYDAAGANAVVHETVLVCVLDQGAVTVDGDSGSPLATAPEGGRLVGMHVASNQHQGGDRIFAVPAWELLTPENYNPNASGEEWALLTPDELPSVAAPRFNDIASFLGRVAAAFHTLQDSQQDGFKALLDWWSANGTGDVAQLAYVLATAWHETGRRMQPVREAFGLDEAQTLRRLRDARARGIIHGDYFEPQANGCCYYGRGFVQLTHGDNYRRVGERLGLGQALFDDPDLALGMDVAVPTLFVGMLEGLFRGRRLDQFVNGPASHDAFVRARDVVNGGGDRAEKIAAYADRFLACLV